MPENEGISGFRSQPSEESAAETVEYSQHELIVPDDCLERAEQLLKELSVHYKKRESRAREHLENTTAWVPGEYTLSLFSDTECSEPVSREFTAQVLQVMLGSRVSARFAESGSNNENASGTQNKVPIREQSAI